MSVSVRRVANSDVDALRDVEMQSFESAQYDLISARQFRYLINKGNAEIWAASSDGLICGYIIVLFKKNSAFGRFYSMAVSPAYQGHNIGKILFELAEKIVVQKGCKGMLLEIREDNLKLLSRYQALGYDITRQVPDYYPDGVACIKMKKILQ